MVSGVKGADVSIYDYLPPEQWKILDKHSKAVMLHLPRKQRLASDDNIRELLDARQKYPNVTIIIAHFGRSFCPYYLEAGLNKLDNGEGFYFDTAAVVNPAVYDIAFKRINIKSILFGTDMPISFWRGKREWTEKTYTNLSSENYHWNKNRKSPEEEAKYTIFLYEEVKSILDALEKNGQKESVKEDIFFRNTRRALKIT
jgi:predicted TIM-barrel fold metal-dependent hydrolase